jgi:hypothetical protein
LPGVSAPPVRVSGGRVFADPGLLNSKVRTVHALWHLFQQAKSGTAAFLKWARAYPIGQTHGAVCSATSHSLEYRLTIFL